MPIVLHDYMGVGHDLSKGAFDSESISKPGSASKLLNEYLPGKFKDSWRALSKDYRTQLKSYEPTMWKKMWDNFGTKGILKLFRAGASKYTVGRPLVHKWIAGVALSDPTVGAVVAAAEVGLATVLETWGDQTTTIRAKKGQWIFIESEESHRRRALGKTGFLKSFDQTFPTKDAGIEGNLRSIQRIEQAELKALAKVPPNEKQPPKKKTVSLGFFIEPTTKNRVSVFSMDLGRALEIEVSDAGVRHECRQAAGRRRTVEHAPRALFLQIRWGFQDQGVFLGVLPLAQSEIQRAKLHTAVHQTW